MEIPGRDLCVTDEREPPLGDAHRGGFAGLGILLRPVVVPPRLHLHADFDSHHLAGPRRLRHEHDLHRLVVAHVKGRQRLVLLLWRPRRLVRFLRLVRAHRPRLDDELGADRRPHRFVALAVVAGGVGDLYGHLVLTGLGPQRHLDRLVHHPRVLEEVVGVPDDLVRTSRRNHRASDRLEIGVRDLHGHGFTELRILLRPVVVPAHAHRDAHRDLHRLTGLRGLRGEHDLHRLVVALVDHREFQHGQVRRGLLRVLRITHLRRARHVLQSTVHRQHAGLRVRLDDEGLLERGLPLDPVALQVRDVWIDVQIAVGDLQLAARMQTLTRRLANNEIRDRADVFLRAVDVVAIGDLAVDDEGDGVAGHRLRRFEADLDGHPSLVVVALKASIRQHDRGQDPCRQANDKQRAQYAGVIHGGGNHTGTFEPGFMVSERVTGATNTAVDNPTP